MHLWTLTLELSREGEMTYKGLRTYCYTLWKEQFLGKTLRQTQRNRNMKRLCKRNCRFPLINFVNLCPINSKTCLCTVATYSSKSSPITTTWKTCSRAQWNVRISSSTSTTAGTIGPQTDDYLSNIISYFNLIILLPAQHLIPSD